jgi:hypothetical protein
MRIGEAIHERDEHRVTASLEQSAQSIKWFSVTVEVTDRVRLDELRALTG